jgi:hypothetical protein
MKMWPGIGFSVYIQKAETVPPNHVRYNYTLKML